MDPKTFVRGLLRRFGFDLVHFDGRRFPERHRAELMGKLGVNLVIDVGANTGQYLSEIRANGFQGQIVAFEPLREPFQALAKSGHRDSRLALHNFAIGARADEVVIHVAANSYSSSLLPMEEAHLCAAPDSGYIREEVVKIRPLDSFGLVDPEGVTWVKIDAQGYERDILAGAIQTLRHASAVEIELTYVSLYKGQALAHEIQQTLGQLGFRLAGFGRPFYDSEATMLLQIDGIFLR